ncbi:MAG: hypothetical protein K6G30_07080 [Acetatifactor sp.]|nr:hypothetical protein [Acetatifactor sp.]
MLNEKKIRIMTRLALSEEKQGKESFEIGKYYRSDYIRYNLLKTMLSVTFGYVLILGMIILYHAEYLITEAVKLDYAAMGKNALMIYLLLLLVYSVITIAISNRKYSRARRFKRKYGNVLGILRKLYAGESGTDPKEEVTKS